MGNVGVVKCRMCCEDAEEKNEADTTMVHVDFARAVLHEDKEQKWQMFREDSSFETAGPKHLRRARSDLDDSSEDSDAMPMAAENGGTNKAKREKTEDVSTSDSGSNVALTQKPPPEDPPCSERKKWDTVVRQPKGQPQTLIRSLESTGPWPALVLQVGSASGEVASPWEAESQGGGKHDRFSGFIEVGTLNGDTEEQLESI